MAQHQDPVQRLETMGLLLGKEMVVIGSETDTTVSLWLSAVDGDAARLIQEALTADGLNDDSRQRVWEQAVRRRSDLGRSAFVELLPVLFARSDCPGTQAAVVRDRDRVSSIFEGRDASFELGNVLLKSLVAANSMEFKTGIGQWIQQISAEGVLSHIGGREDLSDDDIAVLHKVFPSHKKIARSYEDRRNAASEETDK